MKHLRKLGFEPLEKRALLASIGTHVSISHLHRDTDPSFMVADGESPLLPPVVLVRSLGPTRTAIMFFLMSQQQNRMPAANIPAWVMNSPNETEPMASSPSRDSGNSEVTLTRVSLSRSPLATAPPIEIRSQVVETHSELPPAREPRTFEIHPALHATFESHFSDDDRIGQVALSHHAQPFVVMDAPSPAGMIRLGRESVVNAYSSDTGDTLTTRRQKVDWLPQAAQSDSQETRSQPSDELADVGRGLPIPSGMIHLDFAPNFQAMSDIPNPHRRTAWEASIHPFALFQTFVNSDPIPAQAPYPLTDLSEPSDASHPSHPLSWSSIGIVVGLSGFFFAISSRWVRAADVPFAPRLRSSDMPSAR